MAGGWQGAGVQYERQPRARSEAKYEWSTGARWFWWGSGGGTPTGNWIPDSYGIPVSSGSRHGVWFQSWDGIPDIGGVPDSDGRVPNRDGGVPDK